MVRLLKKSPAKASGGLARRLVLGLLLLSTFTLGGIAVAAWTWSVDASGHDRWVLQAFGHKQRGFFVRLAAAPLDDWWMPLRARSPLLSSNWTGLCVDVVPASTTGSTTTHADSQGCRRDHVEQGHDSRRTLADVLRASNAPSAIDYLAIDATKGGDVVLEGFPHDEYQFAVVHVEVGAATDAAARRLPALKDSLLDAGYLLAMAPARHVWLVHGALCRLTYTMPSGYTAAAGEAMTGGKWTADCTNGGQQSFSQFR